MRWAAVVVAEAAPAAAWTARAQGAPAPPEVVAVWHASACAASRHRCPYSVPAAVWRRVWEMLEEAGSVVWDRELGVRVTGWPADVLAQALPVLLAAAARSTAADAMVVDLDAA